MSKIVQNDQHATVMLHLSHVVSHYESLHNSGAEQQFPHSKLQIVFANPQNITIFILKLPNAINGKFTLPVQIAPWRQLRLRMQAKAGRRWLWAPEKQSWLPPVVETGNKHRAGHAGYWQVCHQGPGEKCQETAERRVLCLPKFLLCSPSPLVVWGDPSRRCRAKPSIPPCPSVLLRIRLIHGGSELTAVRKSSSAFWS